MEDNLEHEMPIRLALAVEKACELLLSEKYNPHHDPGGANGGQFTSKPGGKKPVQRDANGNEPVAAARNRAQSTLGRARAQVARENRQAMAGLKGKVADFKPDVAGGKHMTFQSKSGKPIGLITRIKLKDGKVQFQASSDARAKGYGNEWMRGDIGRFSSMREAAAHVVRNYVKRGKKPSKLLDPRDDFED